MGRALTCRDVALKAMLMYEQKPRAPTTDRTTSRRPTWEGGGGRGREDMICM